MRLFDCIVDHWKTDEHSDVARLSYCVDLLADTKNQEF